MTNSHRKYLEDLLRAAQTNIQSAPRKHHLVPASYLRRWESDGRLWITDLMTGTSYESSAAKAARETDFYRIEHADINPDELPPLLFETILSRIEGPGAYAVEFLLSHEEEELPIKARYDLSLFIAFQHVRGRRFRVGLQDMAHGIFSQTIGSVTTAEAVRESYGINKTDDEVAQILEVFDSIRRGDLRVAHSKAALVALSGESAVEIGAFIFSRRWIVYRTAADLVTTDEPVVLLGGRHHPRASRCGVATAGVVLFPIAPRSLLVMFHPELVLSEMALVPELDSAETAEVNLELVSAAHRWRISFGGVRATRMPILPPPVPYSIIEAPVPILNKDGSEIIHIFPPSRWLYAPKQPWPVERWWENDQRRPLGGFGGSPWVSSAGLYLSDEALNRRRKKRRNQRGTQVAK